MNRNLDARDHVSRVLNVHLVYQYKHLIVLTTMLPLNMERQHRLDSRIFLFVPGVGGRVNRLVGHLKNPLVLPVRPSSLSLFRFFLGKNEKRQLTTIGMNSIVQLLKTWTYPEQVVQEFDHIKDHLESYITSSTTTTTTATTATTASSATPRPRIPSRHISHLTQMAAKALNRPVHGLAIRKKQGQVLGGEREKVGWDELEVYKSKANATWRAVGLEKGMGDVEAIKLVEQAGWEGVAPLDRRWDKSWECDRMSK